MSLRYKLFGKPANFDEFVDKVTRRGYDHVEFSRKVMTTVWNCHPVGGGLIKTVYLECVAGDVKYLEKQGNYMSHFNDHARNVSEELPRFDALEKQITSTIRRYEEKFWNARIARENDLEEELDEEVGWRLQIGKNESQGEAPLVAVI